MDFVIAHPGFQRHSLSFRPARLFGSSAVLLDGVPVKRVKGKYIIKNDAGDDVVIQLRPSLIDPVPLVMIGTENVRLVAPLRWFEYAWVGFPVLLVFAGGALGGGIGAFAAFSNSRIFRSERSTAARYALTGLVSLVSLAAFGILAVVIQRALRT